MDSWITAYFFYNAVSLMNSIVFIVIKFKFLRTGLAVIEVGTVRKKNQMNVIMRNLADFLSGGLAFWIYAFGFMYGRGIYTNPFFGAGDFFLNLVNNDPLAAQVFSHYIFQLGYASTTTTIISGAIAERVRFTAYLLWAFLSMIVYGIGGGWIWGQHGFLRNMGAIDFSGGGPIHLIGGAAGLFKFEISEESLSKFETSSHCCCLVHRPTYRTLRQRNQTVPTEWAILCRIGDAVFVVGMGRFQLWQFVWNQRWQVGIGCSSRQCNDDCFIRRWVHIDSIVSEASQRHSLRM